MVFIDKKNIYGKTHEHHVDRLTTGNNEGLPFGQAILAKKADQAGLKSIGDAAFACNRRIFAGVNNRYIAGMATNQV